LFEIIDERLLVSTERFLLRSSNNLARSGTLLLDSRKATSKDGLSNEGNYIGRI
jgi:hypothetical protein